MESVTLELVEEAFRQWRTQRSSLAEPIPENLWGMALRLYPHDKSSKICHRLRLNAGQFKRRLKGGEIQDAVQGFVLASNDDINVLAHQNQAIQLTIQGKERALTFCVEVHLLSQVLPQLSALL